MDKFNSIFQLYDNFTGGFSRNIRLGLAIVLLFAIIWQLYLIIKKGRWIFIVILVILIPTFWPILKEVGRYLFIICKFLITRIGVNI
ncbi:MAG: hypothetical protein WCO23_04555 [bacterium]